MDVGPGPDVLLPVPSQSWSDVSYPLNIAASECTRCGRPTEPENIWNICPSCTTHPRVAMAVGGPSLVKLRPTAHCAACHVPLSVPSHYQAAHVLCPPCQARRAAITTPKTEARAALRANPYPVVSPIATSTRAAALTVAYTYPQLPAPSPSSSSLQSGDALRACMRFGCGVRLPEHVRGDVCETCAGAGFVRPSPMAVPKRVPRRATERMFDRPREPLDLVRAVSRPRMPGSIECGETHSVGPVQSLLRGATVATETEHVEDELEVDLVYPDDVPVVTERTTTTSSEVSKLIEAIEDEDVELELVYPEDAAQTAQTSSSKPRTTLNPPTLRDLFTQGLQTIPALQDLTALANKSPPHCRMPGCNEVLPVQTSMERCVKCSIDDWKQRKMAAMDTSDPTTSSPKTNTSMEEQQVMAMLDEISDIEDGNDHPPSSISPSKNSSNGLTADRGVRPIPGWDSDLTELSSDSESEGVSDSDSDPDSTARPHGNTKDLTIRIPLLVHRLPPDRPLRKCGNKRCNIALPKDHRWKTCDPCRRVQRMYQKVRLENKRRSVLGMEMLEPPDVPRLRWRSLSPEVCQTDATLTPETSRSCSTRHCRSRIPLQEVYRWKTCIGCRARARREARRKRDALVETQHASCPPEIVPRFPAYQNRGALLSSFDAQLKGFVEGQIMYLCAKLHESETWGQGESASRASGPAPMVFVFVGEYSVVTGQRGDGECERDGHDREDPELPELEAMRREVSSVVLELERALRTTFSAGEAFAIDKGGMIMRFACPLVLIAQLRPPTTSVIPGSGPDLSSTSNSEAIAGKSSDDTPPALKPPLHPPAVPFVKKLSGELEAVVVPDESHRLFRGRRTVIRYCMLG